MKPFKSYSQAAQDLYVSELLSSSGGIGEGRYVDIGACHPTEISNTYAFDCLGWDGIMADNDPGAVALLRAQRNGLVIEGDATKVDWGTELHRRWGNLLIDYVSIDVDHATEAALVNFIIGRTSYLNGLGVRVMTVETDAYRFGNGPRDRMREILTEQHGMDLVCADVRSTDDLPYEDWYCCPELSERANRFRCSNKKWTEIFPT